MDQTWKLPVLLILLSHLLLSAISLFHPQPLSAQTDTQWVVPTTVGYGGLGFLATYVVTYEAAKEARRGGNTDYRWGAFPAAALGAYLVGGKFGYRLGKEADVLLDEGVELNPRHRRGVQLGTVLAGATVGYLLSYIPRSTQEGDERRTTVIWSVSGAALAGVGLIFWNRHLYVKEGSLSPRVTPTPEGGVEMGVTLRF